MIGATPSHRLRLIALCASATLVATACDSKSAQSLQDSTVSAPDYVSSADSIAQEMAQSFASMSAGAGIFVSGRDTSDWTARLQGEHVSIIEERARLRDGVAVRAYFFSPNGNLEQLSEQFKRSGVGVKEQIVETQIDFTGNEPRAIRTINGEVATASAEEINAALRHAASLLNAVRAASTPAPKIPNND